MAIRPSEEIFIFEFHMHLPNATPPCFSCIYFLHLQGHLTMAAWTCCIAMLASTCRTHFAYFNASHFSQHRYCCRAMGCRQESAGVWKVIQRLEVPVEHHHFIAASTCGINLLLLPHVESPIQNLTLLKFRSVNFCCFYFSMSRLHTKEIYGNLHHSKISTMRYWWSRVNI